MRFLSVAVLATLPIAFGAPIQLLETTEHANAKRSESAAAIVKALLDSNRLIARDGESQSDVVKRGGATGGDVLGGLGGGTFSAAGLGELGALLGGLGLPKRGAINKRQNLLGGLLGSDGLGDLLGGLLGGVGASAAPLQQRPFLQSPRLLLAHQVLAHTAMHLLQGVILLPEIQVVVLQEMEGLVAAGLPLLEEPVREEQKAIAQAVEIQAMGGQALEDQEVEDPQVGEQAVAVAEAQVVEARVGTLPRSPLRTEVASKKIASARP